uniref:Uncharacterized protein n=1 Tax=Rhizophagus irregularis (strain DAOM 181602 / DAOM 197198 / MUCL 43194) TaxID=747089 RepID=U9TDJ7_RHIID
MQNQNSTKAYWYKEASWTGLSWAKEIFPGHRGLSWMKKISILLVMSLISGLSWVKEVLFWPLLA